MTTLAVAGHDIWVETAGECTPTVMIHCMLSKHEAMLPLAQLLPGRKTLFDLPGHGQSSAWDGTTDYQSLTTQIAADLCTEPAHIVAHSFGATAALRLAVEKPALVSRMTLIEPVYFAAAKGTEVHQAYAKLFRPFVGAMLVGDETRAAQIFNDLWGSAAWETLSPRRQKYLTDRIYLIVAGGGPIEEDADGITSAARLADLSVPVTLIRGAKSPGIIATIHDALSERIPGAKDHVIQGAGHMLPITHASEVAEIIRAAGQETG